MVFRRAVALLGLTLLAPGAAQLVTRDGPRRRLAGRVALRTWGAFLTALGLLAFAWLVHRDFVFGLLTHQFVLRGLALMLIMAGICWPLLTIDAWYLGGVMQLSLRSRRQVALLATLMVVLTCGLPMVAGRRVWAAANLLGGVFGSDRRSAAAEGRYNVLLLGGDAGPDRAGTRPDSVNLASIDAKTGRTVLISLPRNLQNVPFPAGSASARALPRGFSCGDKCLLNAVYQWGGEHPAYFPGVRDPGAEAMKQAVEAITGLKVNYYVLIDLQGFRSMIDAVGGIELTVASRVPIGGETSPISGWIAPGKQHLDGFHALWYARSRATTSDYDRMARQRCVMTAMVNQLDPGTLLKNFQQIAAAGPKVISTDIPAADLPNFIRLGELAKRRRIESVQFVPPLIVPKRPDYSVIRARVAAVIVDIEHGAEVRPPVATAAATASAASAASGVSGVSGVSGASAASGATGSSTGSTGARPAGSGSGTAGGSGAGTAAPAVDVRQVCQAG